MKFAEYEKILLEYYGFDYIEIGEYQRQYLNDDVVTISKDNTDCFTYYLDVDGDDLHKANKNRTICDLTLNELINLL